MYSENWLENNCTRQDLERRYRRADEVWRSRHTQGAAGRIANGVLHAIAAVGKALKPLQGGESMRSVQERLSY
ncbi:MAG: hypothetical protein JXM73_14350 [Anaerolineae bacterium]|nr:hypothetical protein [Anaerolineae bacterium]